LHGVEAFRAALDPKDLRDLDRLLGKVLTATTMDVRSAMETCRLCDEPCLRAPRRQLPRDAGGRPLERQGVIRVCGPALVRVVAVFAPAAAAPLGFQLERRRAPQHGAGLRLADLWDAPGQRTIECMADGCRTLAELWSSAWAEAASPAPAATAADKNALRALFSDPAFAPSMHLTELAPAPLPT
jgi:hypothetical protein